ncbi:MAG: 2-oxoacid:acceptor oxidoreductase subunit alpha [Candidatus Kariarchaeaceae archaeon]
MSNRVMTGEHFILGDYAIAEGALAAGCSFFAGYPITPASQVPERISRRMLEIENTEYIQMEDEIASMAAIIGASCAGAKSMTATSGPGLSLMLENIGLAYMMEVPCVIVNVMRGGPSTGMPTLTSQGDVMQAKWGSHGDVEMIAYAPATIQETFDHTIKCFNAAEKYRTPVILLTDQITGLSTGNLVIPPEEEIITEYRAVPEGGQEGYLPYDPTYLVPPMAIAGEGYNIHMTGLTHNEFGYPATFPANHAKLMGRIQRKFTDNLDDIIEYEEYLLEDAEIAIVCYGTESRSVVRAIKDVREKGIKVGMFRAITVWPFPEEQIKELSKKVKKIIVPEGNMGQYVHPVREFAECEVISLPSYSAQIHPPADIIDVIEEANQ